MVVRWVLDTVPALSVVRTLGYTLRYITTQLINFPITKINVHAVHAQNLWYSVYKGLFLSASMKSCFCRRGCIMVWNHSWKFFILSADDQKMEIIDQTETNLVALRRTIYLTIQSRWEIIIHWIFISLTNFNKTCTMYIRFLGVDGVTLTEAMWLCKACDNVGLITFICTYYNMLYCAS